MSEPERPEAGTVEPDRCVHPSMGVEEALLLVDPSTGHPLTCNLAVVEAAEKLGVRLQLEFTQCQVEPHRRCAGALTNYVRSWPRCGRRPPMLPRSAALGCWRRGGNTRHTRNMRCAHDAATDLVHRPLYRAGILGRSVAPDRRPDRRGTREAHDRGSPRTSWAGSSSRACAGSRRSAARSASAAPTRSFSAAAGQSQSGADSLVVARTG